MGKILLIGITSLVTFYVGGKTQFNLGASIFGHTNPDVYGIFIRYLYSLMERKNINCDPSKVPNYST